MRNTFSRKGYAAWLCAVLLACCLVAGVPGVQALASDSIPFVSSQDGLPEKERAHVVYFTYAGQKEYVFCIYTDYDLVYEYNFCDDESRMYYTIAPWSDGFRKYNGDSSELYKYSVSSGGWYKALSSHFNYNELGVQRGDSFRLLYTNAPITRYDIESSGNATTKIIYKDLYKVFTPSVLSFDNFFHLAPAPELVGTVQGIMWSKMMTEIVGLIPLLVGLVISFLALRKGLAMLYRRLRKG